MMIHQMGYKLRAQIHRFSGKLCSRMGKVTQRFIEEMRYGKKARGSVRLSEVARSREETISLKKVIERLSRNLARRGCAQGIAKAVRTVSKATDGRGIFVFDRGGDRKERYKELLGDPLRRFIVRQRGDRHLLSSGTPCETLTLAQSCTTPYAETVIKEEDGKEKPYFLHFGFRPARLPGHPVRTLWLVVVKGFGRLPLPLIVGVLISASGVAAAGLQPFTAALVDRIGHHKRFIQAGLVLISLATLAFILVGRYLDLLGRRIHGFLYYPSYARALFRASRRRSLA